MDYVIRTLDINGKLREERLMFYSVRILDKNGILKRVVKEKLLGQKYWESFSNKKDRKHKAKGSFNERFRSNSDPSLVKGLALRNHHGP